MMSPKQIKKAEKIWSDRSLYLNQLFGESDIREEPDGLDFRYRYVAVGDSVIISTESGQIRSGIIWKIMGFGKGCRNYFVFVPSIGRVLVRAPAYIAKDTSE